MSNLNKLQDFVYIFGLWYYNGLKTSNIVHARDTASEKQSSLYYMTQNPRTASLRYFLFRRKIKHKRKRVA